MAILSYDEYKKKNKKQIEERNKREYEKRAVNVSEKKNTKNDIAPIKTTNKNDRTWFNTGAFSDGYQLGDISKTILGTLKDVKQDVSKGVLRIGEGVVDTGAYLVGGASKLLGNDNFADKTKKFIARDLVEESKAANLLANANNQTDILFDLGKQGYKAIKNKDIKELTNFNDSFEKDSLLGDKSDSLVQSGGQLAGTVGLQTLGVPWWLTTGVTSFGGETQQAFNQKATYGEAGFSGLVSAGAEILTEKISGGIKFGGRTLDEGLQRLISEKITNKVLQNATKLGVDMVGEGSEEVLSEIISNVGRKLSYENEKTWGEILTSEEAMDSYLEAFIGGAVLGGAGSTVQIAQQQKRAVQQAEQELGRKLTTEETTQIEKSVEKQVQNASKTEVQEEIAPIKEQKITPKEQEPFINSKVRDNDGNLLKVYHGTRADFDTFDTSKAGQNYQNNWSNNGKGIYFTDNIAEAQEFAESSIDNGDPKIKEAYLDINNPFDSSKDYTNELSEMAQEYGIEPYYLERGDRLFNWFNINKKDIVEALSKYGYDGIVDHGHYTVFDPKQIKSVDNNNKTENTVQNVENKPTETQSTVQNSSLNSLKLKNKQLEIIKKHNPMEDDYHTGIRNVNDIKTAQEVFTKENFEEVANPDFTYEMSQEALKKGKVKVYSSYPIEQGVFVSTSKMEAESYSSNGKVYEKTVDLNDIAWIENTQGQYAKVESSSQENATQKAEKSLNVEPKKTKEPALKRVENINEDTQDTNLDEDILPENNEQRTITKEWTDKVNEQNEVNTPLAKEQAKATGHNTMIGYSPILSNYKLYSNGSLSWVTPEGKLNSKVIAETEIDTFLSKNKIDRLVGGINTFENGLTNQLSNQNDIAPIKQELAVLTNEIKTTIKETKKELKSLTSEINEVKASVNEVIEENKVLTETDIPIVEAQASENLNALTDNDIAPIQEDTTPEYESNSTTIESPFDTRDIDEVGNRKVKAYQYENPEVRPYFEMEAKIMLREIEDTVKGARMPIYDEVGNMEYVGVTRETTDAIAYLKDNYNYTYAEIEKGLNAIIEDNGKENIAVAKRIEFMLDDRLRNGYTAIDGMQIPPNQEYIDFLHEKGITEYNQETSLGLTDEHAPAEQFTEEEIIEKNKKIQEASIENATENHPPLTDEFIEELNKQSIEWAKESGKLKESKPVESASNTQQVEEIAPVKEQKPTLKEVTNQDDPVMKAVKDKARKQLEKTIGERRNELISNDKYANNNIVIKKKQSLKESATKTWDAFQSHFINRNRQIDKLSKATKNDEIKFKGDRVNNIAGEIGGDIFTAQTDNYGNVIGKSLDSPFEAARQEGIDTYFDNYLKHQSNIERHAQGKGSSKISAETSKKYVKAYESKYPQLKELAKDVYTYNQNLLDNAVQNGLIDEKFKNVLTTMYGKYVPFYEQNTEPSTYMTPDEIKASRPIKKAKGGTDSNLLGIEQAMIQQTYAYKNAIAKNDLYKEIGSVMGKKVELGADLRTSPTQLNDTLYADENGKYLTYYENGQQKTVQITDELYTELSRDLENQIRNLEEKYSLIAKPLQKISQLRGQILTTYNIGFVATNPFKDIQDALLNTKNFKGYLKNVLTQSTINDSTKGKNVNKYAEDFKALTGKDITSIRDAKTLKRKARSIYKDYQAGTMWNRFITSYGTNATSMEFGEAGVDVKAKNKGFLRGIERANNYMEVMFRYPEFKATLERGGSFTEALYNAREVTTNFGRGGTISKAINRNGATFFNTSVQGMDKFIRNFSGENGARGFIGAVSKATAVGLLPAILNHLLFDDDDEYEALPDYIKDNYYLFKTGYGEFIRIPKGRMISVLGSSARRSLELASGEEDAFEGFLKNASDQVGASNPLKENIFSPLIQAYGSENGEAWYGDDLVPTRLQNKPKAEQFDEGTDEFSKWLGKQLNISPYKINYVIDQYSGGFGDLILPMITDEAKSDGTLLAPLKDKFTTNSTDDNKYVGELYDLSEELTIKANGESATEEDILKNKYLNSIKSQMSELYKEKREIQSSGMSKEAKYAQAKVIQNMINALAKEGLDFHTVIETTDNYASVGYYEEYYKTSEGEWYSINDKELEAINSMGMTTEEKNSYFGAKTNIYEIKDEYEDLLSEASEEEKDILYTEQKRAIIDEVRNTNLTDEEKAYLYDRYYGSADKLNVITETNIPLDAYLDIEYQDFKADKDRYGKSVSGSKKKKIMNYIESSGLDYNQKIILHKVYYPADDSYNYEIADYVFNNVETYEQRINILETLGFKIGEDGIVRWE